MRKLRISLLRVLSEAIGAKFEHPRVPARPTLTARPIARYNPATMASDSTTYFDLRTYRRHMKSGRLTEAEYQAHLAELPDASDNIMDPEEGGDDDGWDARNRADRDEPEAPAAPAPTAAMADPFAPAPGGAPLPPVSAPIVPSAPAPSVNDAPAPPPPPLEVPIGGAAPIIPPKVD